MKVLILALALTCVAAVPTDVASKDARIVDLFIRSYIEELSERVGRLDPHRQPLYAGSWGPPGAEEILYFYGYALDVRANDFSKFYIGRIDYNLWSGALTFDLNLDSVEGSINRAYGEVNVFDWKATAEGRGDLAISGIRIDAAAIVALGTDGVVITDVNASIKIGNVRADIDLEVYGYDVVGAYITRFLNNLPDYTERYAEQITAVLNYAITWYINRRD